MPVTIFNEDGDNEIQSLFQQLHNSSQANESATKIQTWVRQVLDQKKSHQLHHDPLLEKIYNEIVIFCQGALSDKKEKTLHKYIILLRGPTVDVIVKLNKMQSKMDATKDELNKDKDMDKIEECVSLLDDFKFVDTILVL